MLREVILAMVALTGTIAPFSVSLAAAEQDVKDQASQLLENKEKDFSIEVPPDWLKDKSREGLDLFVYAPVPATDKIALTNLGIVAGKVSRDLALTNFYKVNVENLPKAFEDFVEISSGTGGIPNQTTNWITFSRKLKTEAGEIILRELQYYLIAGDYGYVITFSATPNEYVMNRGIFEKIISTFKVIDKPVIPIEPLRTMYELPPVETK